MAGGASHLRRDCNHSQHSDRADHGPLGIRLDHRRPRARSDRPRLRARHDRRHLRHALRAAGADCRQRALACESADGYRRTWHQFSDDLQPRGRREGRAQFRWGVSMPDYMATADDDMICMITIEHVEAVNRIDEIMAVPGIDVAVIGPGDLATSIDKRGRVDDPEVLALMARAEAGILKSGVPVGGVARTAEQANQMIERGYVALALGFDWSLFQRGIAASFDGIKR